MCNDIAKTEFCVSGARIMKHSVSTTDCEEREGLKGLPKPIYDCLCPSKKKTSKQMRKWAKERGFRLRAWAPFSPFFAGTAFSHSYLTNRIFPRTGPGVEEEMNDWRSTIDTAALFGSIIDVVQCTSRVKLRYTLSKRL